MRSHDGAEACELVGLYILLTLLEKLCDSNIGLYRDGGLGALHTLNTQALDRRQEDITEIFKKLGLKITIETDVALNLRN